MKILTIAAVLLAMLALPAHAQARRPHEDGKKAAEGKPKVDENAYKAALERIPELQGEVRPLEHHQACGPRQETEVIVAIVPVPIREELWQGCRCRVSPIP